MNAVYVYVYARICYVAQLNHGLKRRSIIFLFATVYLHRIQNITRLKLAPKLMNFAPLPVRQITLAVIGY